MIENQHLTKRFMLYDLLKTDHLEHQAANRVVTPEQVAKLQLVAAKLEHVITIVGDIVLHSAYRCPALNTAIGSTARSQHLLCEAADFTPALGHDFAHNKVVFDKLVHAAKLGGFYFGQLILESADRQGLNSWCHVSLGEPFRDRAKCGQVLVMQNGKYSLIETIKPLV